MYPPFLLPAVVMPISGLLSRRNRMLTSMSRASCSEPQTVAMKIPAELPIDADDFKGQSILIFKLALLLQLVKEQFCFLS